MLDNLFSFYFSVESERITEISLPLEKLFRDRARERLNDLLLLEHGLTLAEGETVTLNLEAEPRVQLVSVEQRDTTQRIYLVPLADEIGKFLSAGLTEQDLNSSDPLCGYWRELTRLSDEVEQRSNELHHAERMASLGTLAAGVAHEINNPLAYIKSNLMSLEGFLQPMVLTVRSLLEIEHRSAAELEKLKELGLEYDSQELTFILEDLDDLLVDLRDGSERIVTIVSGLKQFSHPSHQQRDFADLNEAVRVAVELSRNEFKYHVDLQTDLQPLPKIRANSSEITQVLVNLIVNAAQAIPDKGRIKISSQLDGEMIELKVSDTGSGIPDSIINKIFNPFYTTKEIGKGTGLGLSISHRIVKEHGGTISVSSKPGEMTEFVLRFPVAQQ